MDGPNRRGPPNDETPEWLAYYSPGPGCMEKTDGHSTRHTGSGLVKVSKVSTKAEQNNTTRFLLLVVGITKRWYRVTSTS